MTDFKSKIKKIRNTLKISQIKLAKMLGASQASVSAWERGVTGASFNYICKLEKLCTKKGINIDWRK